jgi:N,N'-diacetylchitobiose transport system substrate-binding protein
MEEDLMKKVNFALIVCGMIVLFVSCNKTSGPGTAGASNADGKYDATISWNINAPSDLVRVEFDAWLDEVKAKVKDRTGVTLTTEIVSWADYLNKHLASIASGSGPNIIQMGSTTYPVIMGAGGLVALDSYLEGFGGADAFYESALYYGRWKGQIQALPWGGGGRAYYYRKDLLDQAGLSYPTEAWTWADYVDYAKKLTETLGKPAAIACGAGGDAAYYFWYTLEAENGQILNDDYTEVLFNNETGVKTIRKILDMYTNKYWPGTFAEYAMGDYEAAFINGEVAIAVGSDGWMIELAQSPIADKYGIVPPPRGPSGKFTNLLIPSMLGITSYTKEVDAAVATLQILLSEEEVTNFNTFSGWLPFRKDSLKDPYFADDPLREAFRYSIENGTTFFPQHPRCAAMRDSTVDYLQIIYTRLVTTGNVTDEFIKEQLDKCAAEVKAML